jgi:hypothetical protein
MIHGQLTIVNKSSSLSPSAKAEKLRMRRTVFLTRKLETQNIQAREETVVLAEYCPMRRLPYPLPLDSVFFGNLDYNLYCISFCHAFLAGGD